MEGGVNAMKMVGLGHAGDAVGGRVGECNENGGAGARLGMLREGQLNSTINPTPGADNTIPVSNIFK